MKISLRNVCHKLEAYSFYSAQRRHDCGGMEMERNIMYIEVANICYFGLVISGSKWDKQFLVFDRSVGRTSISIFISIGVDVSGNGVGRAFPNEQKEVRFKNQDKAWPIFTTLSLPSKSKQITKFLDYQPLCTASLFNFPPKTKM